MNATNEARQWSSPMEPVILMEELPTIPSR